MIVILGSTCSGKDTLAKVLCKDYGYEKIITCTTRPIREGEIPDKTYHYFTKEEFMQLMIENRFFEYTSYNVANGETWFYGTLKEDISRQIKNGILILNPEGFIKFRKYYPSSFFVRLYAPISTIRRRAIQRGDDVAEASRRIKADIEDFAIIETSNICNMSINSNNFSPNELAKIIDKQYKEYLANEK